MGTTHERLRAWGESLNREGNDLGDSLLEYADAWHTEVEGLRDLTREIQNKLYALPELNMSNYDHDEVSALNEGVNELYCWLETQIGPRRVETKKAARAVGGEHE